MHVFVALPDDIILITGYKCALPCFVGTQRTEDTQTKVKTDGSVFKRLIKVNCSESAQGRHL